MSKPPSAASAGTRATAGRRSGWFGFSPLARTVAELTTPLLGRRGLVEGRMMIEWPLIVGERIAARTRPERVSTRRRGDGDGTLQIRVASGAMALELQHETPQLIERINRYFGFRAIGRLRLVRGPLLAPPSPPPPLAPPSPEAAAQIDTAVAGIEDMQLKQVLVSLGRCVHAPRARSGQ